MATNFSRAIRRSRHELSKQSLAKRFFYYGSCEPSKIALDTVFLRLYKTGSVHEHGPRPRLVRVANNNVETMRGFRTTDLTVNLFRIEDGHPP